MTTPIPANNNLQHTILGDDIQMLEISLLPGQRVIARPGAMNYMEDHIEFETLVTDGTQTPSSLFEKIKVAGKRSLAGSAMLAHFKNQSETERRITFSSARPGKIIAVNLAEIKGPLHCQSSAFLCATHKTKIDSKVQSHWRKRLFSGEGFFMQTLSGDGTAFLHVGGLITQIKLTGEKMRLNTGCIAAFTEGISYDVERVRGIKSMVFGGEGMFFTTIQGHGTVLIQSIPHRPRCSQNTHVNVS